ncbi:MAG TPA: beta-ketoacyl-[acyl-carrier-protein] synthase family protein [Verrucomicrobiae bacterium]|nr:beta-ketoacyl-[acyl-carrier-protein] synthase family protein [Verrucomicrobiae bacterium]
MTTPADKPVAITGCAAITACGDGLAPLERALADNASALRPCARFTGSPYQTNVVGAVPDEAWATLREGDPGHAGAPAFLLANHVIRRLRPRATGRVGLVLSTTKADIVALERGDTGNRHILPGQLAADLAAANDITGPVRCVSVACVSGLLAIQTGAELIRRGEADSVIVAGVDLLSHFVVAGFSALKSLDPEGCRPFDKDRIGLSVGEGAGAILLARGAGMTVAGWGSSNDANHLTGPSRDGSGLALAMQRALRRAGVAPGDVDYVHAHGTGTLYNDSMEALALRWVFGDRVPAFSSSKGLFGHTLGAAGVLETVLCVIAANDGLVPGTPRLRVPADDMPATLQIESRHGAKLRTIMKINAGFGGTNAALALRI